MKNQTLIFASFAVVIAAAIAQTIVLIILATN